MNWISVKDQLPPKDNMRVIIWHENWPCGFLFATYRTKFKEFIKDIFTHEIQFPVAPTHWMTLLSPEEIDESNEMD